MFADRPVQISDLYNLINSSFIGNKGYLFSEDSLFSIGNH